MLAPFIILGMALSYLSIMVNKSYLCKLYIILPLYHGFSVIKKARDFFKTVVISVYWLVEQSGPQGHI